MSNRCEIHGVITGSTCPVCKETKMCQLETELAAMRLTLGALTVTCCGKRHPIIQWTDAGPKQYGAECSVCGRRIAEENPVSLINAFVDASMSAMRERAEKAENALRVQLEMEEFRTKTFNDFSGMNLDTLSDLVQAWKEVKAEKEKAERERDEVREKGEKLCCQCGNLMTRLTTLERGIGDLLKATITWDGWRVKLIKDLLATPTPPDGNKEMP